jgi:vacuolar-type H+-ATPase subunit F/Vma7
MAHETTWEYPRGARVLGFELFGTHSIDVYGRPEEHVYNPRAKRRQPLSQQRSEGVTEARPTFVITPSIQEANRKETDQITVSSELC